MFTTKNRRNKKPLKVIVKNMVNHQLLVIIIFFIMNLSHIPVSESKCANETDCLLQLKDSLQNATALDSSWKIGTPPCLENKEWVGVRCENGSVTSLRLEDLGLIGSIPVDALINFNNLRSISFSYNSLSGNLPDFSVLGKLKSLYLTGNHFSGDIPKDFFSKMKSLRKIYLGWNNFTGLIPTSLARVSNLIELHLEHNEFEGHVPYLPQSSIKEVDFSYNQLVGAVPEGMVRFSPEAFSNNLDLCSPRLEKKCTPGPNNLHVDDDEEKLQELQGSTAKWIVIGSIVALLLVALLITGRPKEELYHGPGLPQNGAATLRLQSSKKRNSRSGNYGRYRSSRVASVSMTRSVDDIVIVNERKGYFGLQDLMKAAAQVLGNGGVGSAYKAAMMNGVSVVVKRLREVNDISKEAIDVELRKFGRLNHQNILPLLAYHYRDEEKLLVSEYVPNGSLLYMLHGDRSNQNAESLNWETRLKIIKGVARGLGYLYSEFPTYDLPHGNLKSSNILIGSDFEPLLSDYGFHSLINNTCAVQSLFGYNVPETVLYQQISRKSDVYCLGVVILEILTGHFPSQYLNNQQGGTDVIRWVTTAISERRENELIDPEMASSASADSIVEMEKLLHIGAACTVNSPDMRINMKEAIMRIDEIQV